MGNRCEKGAQMPEMKKHVHMQIMDKTRRKSHSDHYNTLQKDDITRDTK